MVINPSVDVLHVGYFVRLFAGRFNRRAMPINMQPVLSHTLADSP